MSQENIDRILKLSPKAGDVIVIETSKETSSLDRDYFRRACKELLPEGVEVMVLGPNARVSLANSQLKEGVDYQIFREPTCEIRLKGEAGDEWHRVPCSWLAKRIDNGALTWMLHNPAHDQFFQLPADAVRGYDAAMLHRQWHAAMDVTPRSDAEHSVAAIRADAERRKQLQEEQDSWDSPSMVCANLTPAEQQGLIEADAIGKRRRAEAACAADERKQVLRDDGKPVTITNGETVSFRPTLRIGDEPPMTLESVEIVKLPTELIGEPAANNYEAAVEREQTWRDREPLL